MNSYDKNTKVDALFIKKFLKKMDKDIAARFVLSGLSLSKIKIEDAFILACEEMSIREKKKIETKKSEKTSVEDKTSLDKSDSNKAIIDLLEDIFFSKKYKTKKEK